MTVRELIKELLECDMNHTVRLSLEDGYRFPLVAGVEKPSVCSSNNAVVLVPKERER